MNDQSDQSQPDRHLSDGALRAFLDHEVPPAQALRYALHLRRCAECRADRLRFVSQPQGCGVDAIVTALARAARSDRTGS